MLDFWVYLHILLLVFWVGTDLGVFLAARYSERAELAFETRQTVLQLGMILDRLPRTALVLIIPTGVMIAMEYRWLILPVWILAIIWSAALLWLLILWQGFLSPNPAVQARCTKINWWLNLIAAGGAATWGLVMVFDPAVPLWLALKVIMVGGIFTVGFILDLLFTPAMMLFAQLSTDPENKGLNQSYSKALGPVYLTVVAIYILALTAAALGVFKLPI